VREFVEAAFDIADIKLGWKGKGVDEVGVNTKTGKVLVRIDPRYRRPTEVDLLLGNAAKAKRLLGWEPKTRFADLVRLMVESDLARASLHNSRGH
jgi:GDPmannose 4,6-dehydratase